MNDQLSAEEESRLRGALRVIAEQVPIEDHRFAFSRVRLLLTAAVVITAMTVAGITLGQSGGAKHIPLAAPRASATAISGGGSGGSIVPYDLNRLVTEADRVVIGEVVEVRRGDGSDAGGIPYILARIRVEQALAGSNQELWAFDYDTAGGTSEDSNAGSPPWAVGVRLLLFLTKPVGTVHDGVKPEHWQVTGGFQGRYGFNGNHLNAPFTLDQVRAGIAAKR